MNANQLLRATCAAAVVAVCLAAPVRGQEVTSVTLASDCVDFALNAETGDLAAVDPTADTVTLYKAAYLDGKSDQKVGPLKVGSQPVSIVYKKYKNRGVFVVSCLKDAHLYVIDALELTLLRKVSVASDSVSMVAASQNAADPYIYYCYGGGHDSTTGRITLAKLSDEGPVFDDSMDCAVSADGNLFYRRGPWSPSGFESLRKVEGGGQNGKPRFDRVFYDHDSTAQYVPDPFGEYTAAGANIYTAELNKRMGQAPAPVLCFFPNKPIIVCLQDSRLVTASYNTFQQTATVTLPVGFLKTDDRDGRTQFRAGSDGDFKWVGHRVRAFADVKGDRIVLAYHDQAAAVEVALLKLPDEPLLRAELTDPAPLRVGEDAKIGLTKADPKTKVEILDGPEGLKVDGEGLTWTPADDQVGPHVVKLTLSRGDVERVQSFELQVVRPHAVLSFAPAGFQISNDGRLAICWRSPPAGERAAFGEPAPADSQTTKMAVVDLTKLEVTAEIVVPYRVVTAAIDADHVYVASAASSTLNVLTTKDLKRKKQLYADDDLGAVAVLGNKYLSATTQTGKESRFLLPDLTVDKTAPAATPADGLPRAFRPDMPPPAKIGRVSDGWLIDGIVYDDTMQQAQLLCSLPAIRNIDGRPVAVSSVSVLSAPPSSPNGYYHPSSDGVAQLGTVVLEHQPVAVTLRVARKHVSVATHTGRLETTVTLALAPKPNESARQHITLAKHTQIPAEGQSDESTSLGQIRSTGDQVVVVQDKMLFVHTIDKLDPESFPGRMKFGAKQSAKVISSTEPTKLTHTVTGGKKPFQATLIIGRPEVSIDADTMTVTVDGPALVKWILAAPPADSSDIMPRAGRNVPSLPATSLEDLVNYKSSSAATFEKATGRKPQGIPFALPIAIRATDSEARSADLGYLVLLEVPEDALKEAVKAREADLAKLKAKRGEELAAQRAAAEAARVRPVEGGGDVAQRVQQLEERVKSLEAKIDLLTKLLQQRVQQ